MSHLTVLQIIRLSKEHNRIHEKYIEGHCPWCNKATLDFIDFKAAEKYLLPAPRPTSQTRSENKV